MSALCCSLLFFFFNDTATTEIYTLSLHDALPIWVVNLVTTTRAAEVGDALLESPVVRKLTFTGSTAVGKMLAAKAGATLKRRSEEHTSELQSRQYLVCRLLLEKKKHRQNHIA